MQLKYSVLQELTHHSPNFILLLPLHHHSLLSFSFYPCSITHSFHLFSPTPSIGILPFPCPHDLFFICEQIGTIIQQVAGMNKTSTNLATGEPTSETYKFDKFRLNDLTAKIPDEIDM